MNLIEFLKDNENTRKIFGERELKIIEKQLLGVNLTQSEKNRLSRDIRKKFEFIKDISRFEKDFKIKKGEIIKKIINETKEIILEDELKKRIKEIYVYGSFVKNKMSLQSDIDIAVIFDKIDIKEATNFRKRISGKVSSKADVQVYNTLPSNIQNEIDKEKNIIYTKS